jgi:copper homeostasis protein (lipoprotein)
MKKYSLHRASASALFVLVCLFFIQCTEALIKVKKVEPPIFIDGHNSVNSLDWNGTYKGTMPCNDCTGIETELTLTLNQDYTLKTNHQGKIGKVKEEKGSFTWNGTGSVVTLSGIKNPPNQYFVGENRLLQLDVYGNKITGSGGDMYILIKQMPPVIPSPIKLGDNWELNFIANSPITFQELYPNKKPTIRFDSINNLVSGNTSCNNFAGKLTVNGDKINFASPLAMTKMACLDGKVNGENLFMETLQKVNTYAVSDSSLNFIMGDIAIMRFVKK